MATFSREYDYGDVPTIKKFNESDKFFRVIIGPFGSGKSSGCVAEIIDRGVQQAPNSEGVRRTRWAVVRNSYPQLHGTTMKTFFEWLPPDHFGDYNVGKHDYTINKITLEDGTRVEIEVMFRALDKPDQVRDLLSLELTGAWFNELREIPWAIVDAMEGRVKRFPPKIDGGFTWSGVIGDSNPPDTDSKLYKLFEEQVPRDMELAGKYELFRQPSGRSDNAENLRWLDEEYYSVMAIGKDQEFIKVYIDGEYGYVRDGKPVYSNFSDAIHTLEEETEAIKGVPLIASFDFGMNGACIIAQLTPTGRFTVLKELFEPDVGLRRFLNDVVKPYITTKYRGFEVITTGDPAGTRRADTDERSAFDELMKQGFPATPAHSNSFLARFNAVDIYLTKLLDGKGAFQLNPSCTMLRKGFLGEYKMRKILGYNDTQYSERPVKNEFSHLHDALQYACMVADRGFETNRGYMGDRYKPPVRSRRKSMAGWT